MLKKKIAVTGSRGFMAQHLIKEIKKLRPKQLIELDIKDGYDLTKIGKTGDILEGVDVVFHLATLPLNVSLRNPYYVANEIYLMSLTLCELARQGVFKTLIQVSSSEAYGSAITPLMDEQHPLNPTTPYAAAKASADLLLLSYIRSFGVDAAIARPFNNYGPGQPVGLGGVIPNTIHRILNKEHPVIFGDGEQIRDFIYVKDTVEGIIKLYKKEYIRHRVVNLSANNPVKIISLVNLICELMDYKGKIEYQNERISDVKRHCGEGRLARDLLDFIPNYSLREGLKETIRWYSSHI